MPSEPAGGRTLSADFRQFLSMRALFRQQWQIKPRCSTSNWRIGSIWKPNWRICC